MSEYIIETKCCPTCEEIKPHSEFYKKASEKTP